MADRAGLLRGEGGAVFHLELVEFQQVRVHHRRRADHREETTLLGAPLREQAVRTLREREGEEEGGVNHLYTHTLSYGLELNKAQALFVLHEQQRR